MVKENHLAPTPTNCTDPHSLRRTRFTLALRKAILPPAMVLGTYTAKSTRLRGSNNLYLPVSHIQLPRVMPLIVMLLKTVTTPTTLRASTATATELSAATLQCTELLTVSLSGSGTESFCSSPKRLCCWKSPGS